MVITNSKSILNKQKNKIMKKIIISMAVLFTALAACQKPINPQLDKKEVAFLMPTSEEEARASIVITEQARATQDSIVRAFEKSLAMQRSNSNSTELSVQFAITHSDVEWHYQYGRYLAKFKSTITVLANKTCYMPWEFGFVPGAPENNTSNPPASVTTAFKNQFSFFDEMGMFPSGIATTLEEGPVGQLWPETSHGFNTIVSGASRTNGYFSPIKLKANQVARIDLAIILGDNFTLWGGEPIPSWALIGMYTCWLRGLRVAENLGDDPTKWLEVIGNNTSNTIVGQSQSFPD